MPTSGKFGVVANGATPIIDVKNWTVNQTVDAKSYGASNTKGGTNRRPGLLDWTGNFIHNGMFPNILLMPGNDITFNGYVGDGVQQNAVALTASGLAFIDDISVVWNWETNELQEITYNMSSQASVLTMGQGQFQDTSSPSNTIQTASAVVEIATDVDSFATFWPICVKQATLNILANPQNSSSSCTVVSGPFQTQRKLPGLVDWNLALVMDAISTAPFWDGGAPPTPLTDPVWSPGDYVIIRIIPDSNAATKFWELRYGFVNDLSNFVVNMETGELVSYTQNFMMAADGGFGSGLTDSQILIPDVGANIKYWPTDAA